MGEKMDDFIVTRGAMYKRNADKDFAVLSYTAKNAKQKSNEVKVNVFKSAMMKTTTLSNQSKRIQELRDSKKEQDAQMKKTRFDVIKFGMSGFDVTRGGEAKISLAVKLGAKPPKRQGQNYKELKLARQKAKESIQRQEQMSAITKNLVKPRINKKHKKQPDLISCYGVMKDKRL